MLLARQGYRVLLVDRATFPSDTISTHVIHPTGIAALPDFAERIRAASRQAEPPAAADANHHPAVTHRDLSANANRLIAAPGLATS